MYHHINALWHSIYHWCEGDPRFLYIIIPVCLRISVYWTICLPFTLIDLTGKPEFLHKYKIQKLDCKNYPVRVADAIAVIRRVLFNQTFVAIPCVILIYHLWKSWEFRGLKYEAPSVSFIIIQLFLHTILSEIIVYSVHRTLHTRSIYKRIHKTHHLWDKPIAITAVYVHPVEHVFMNVIPFYIPSFIFGAHPINLWIWIVVGTSYNVFDHIGYHLPFFPHSPEYHDFHHKRIWNNFGSVGFLDKLFGTDDLFKKSKEYQRHTILLSFKSMKELFPDDD
ncbi:fatty acid hydroxylase domain-containing protein 2-like [Centruroides vittatus]|uniref:fatty acid hydroxylase domain-containing protein 2-like n=1 Tax=Centruroides vittatus TaxID=120091 RepID=UPI00351075EC